ncbi:MAG: pentapeptide repeat-containing protein [Deltaproteobacteria bacterium]|nr:pentapeptide repeat-containing protein [Deltaproteobacteria bacterium]
MRVYRSIEEIFHNGVPVSRILKAHEKWVKQREGQKADLIGADLSGTDLGGAYLRGADLIKTDMSETDLRNANLSEANLFGANLSGSKMTAANLRRVNLEQTNLSEVNLSGADLAEANLKGAYLAWTKMIRSNLSEADMQDAYMRGADLTLADLSKCQLKGAQMIGANLYEAKMAGSSLDDANLAESYLRQADLSYAALNKVNLSEANLERAVLHSANLSGANLTASNLIGADLRGAILNGVFLENAKLMGWKIAGVTCTHIFGKDNVLIRFQSGEFEKKYARRQRSCEIMLKVPLTASGYYIGKFITRSINHIWGSRVIELKGIEVLTEEDTKFIFNIFDVDFFEQQKKTVEINLRVALNKYFRDRTADRDQSYFGDIVEDTDKKEVPADNAPHREFQPWGINHHGMVDKLIAHYSKLGKMGESIYDIVDSMFG